ncbi:MAG: DUF2786 domain-containing protein [Microthrixaceae bacterium]
MTDEPRPDPADDRRLATVRALLAKAEASEFPDEAEAFFAKASELIARFAIDEALLWADAPERDHPDEIRLVIHAPYLAQKAVLVHAVAVAHGCQSVRLVSGPGHRSEVISVVGFPGDLRWVETLVTSLLVQLTSAMLSRCPTGLTSSGSAGWRRSFIMGFAEEVSTRLRADREAAAGAAGARAAGGAGSAGAAGGPSGPSVALVLAERSGEVRDEFRRRYPSVRSAWASRGSSADGHRAGRRAGKEASLGRDAVGGRRGLGPG